MRSTFSLALEHDLEYLMTRVEIQRSERITNAGLDK